jgi:SPP1 gp7 family putative phage head morphogenesis protein
MAGIVVRSTSDGQTWVDARTLQEHVFGGGEVPDTDQFYRKYYGRNLTPATIEHVIQEANAGYMRSLSDLESETVGIDGHLFNAVGKRFPALASVDYDVTPATGPGIDPAKAQQCAELVRQGFSQIPNLRQAIVDLTWGHFHGRSSVEKQWIYKPASALKWSITELNWIHPRRLSFGPERELRLNDSMFQRGYFEASGFDLRSVPFKWIQFTPRLRNEYPEREGIGPICLYWAYFKRFSTRERLILMEVFGKPWRIVEVEKDAKGIGAEQLDRAQDTADKLGSNASAQMPPGIHLKVEQPGRGAGEVHADVVEQANDEISKIVNGQTRTSAAKSGAGLNSSADDVAASEQDQILGADGWRLSSVLTEQLARDFVVLNRGPEWAAYTPSILLRTQRQVSRKEQIDNTTKALAIGVPLKLDEVYERTGFEKPAKDDATVQLVNAGDRDAFGNATSVTKTVIIDPTKPPPVPPKPAQGTPPVTPPGAPPAAPQAPKPPEPPASNVTASTDTMPEPTPAELLAAKLTESGVDRCEHGSSNRCRLCGVERVRDFEIVDGETVWKVAWKAIDPTPASATTSMSITGGELVLARHLRESIRSIAAHGDLVCKARQPDSQNGTPEALIDRGVRDTARETSRWGVALVDATEGLDTAGAIFEALNRAAARLPLATFARTAERKILHGLMLGALDSMWERENEELIPLESFSQVRDLVLMVGEQQPLPFAEQPFDRAVRLFRAKTVLPRDTFEQLSGAAKRRAFTVARLARQDLLATTHAELARMIQSGENAMVTGEGPSLGEFKKFAAARLESAGWVPANPSHVETIYRTNVMGAYSDGRKAEMVQPDVLAARPIWQARGVGDSRTRPAHKAAHGLCFAAGDASWPGTPWGYNCRCRIISRSQRWLAASAKALSACPPGIPDDGFDSSEGSLLSDMAAE